jgi:uncharacterized protein (TIGR03066 family)
MVVRSLVLFVALAAFTLAPDASSILGQEAIDRTEILGTWQVVQTQEPKLNGAVLNLGIYETLKLDLDESNRQVSMEGRYVLHGKQITITIGDQNENETTETYSIEQINDAELVLKNDQGRATKFHKTRNVFAPPTQEEWAAIARGGGYSEAWKESDGTLYNDLIYDETAELGYDLYIPAREPKATSQGAIIMLHGGGWNSGSRKSLAYAARRYAKAGYITALVSYSFITSDSDVTMNRLLDDIEHATAAIKTKTTELDINVDKLALFGISAGGHLALLYSYSRVDQSPIPVALVFEQSGTTDFHPDSFRSANTSARLVTALTGKEVSVMAVKNGEAEALINSVSPLAYVNAKSVPTLLAYGDKDDIVLPIHAKKLAETLEKHGVKHEYVTYPNSGHFLDSDPERRDRFRQLSLEYLREVFGY